MGRGCWWQEQGHKGTRFLDTVERGPLSPWSLVSRDYVLPSDSTGQVRMTSSEKSTEKGEDSHRMSPSVEEGFLVGSLGWTSQHLAQNFQFIPEAPGPRQGHLWCLPVRGACEPRLQPVTQL